MTKYTLNKKTLTDIADAIREKASISNKIKPSKFAESIKKIEANGRLVIPVGTTEIPNEAYYGNQSIKSVLIPPSVTRIGRNAFSGCTSLELISLGGARDALYIDAQAFSGCTALKNIIIPEGTQLSYAAFSDCTGLTDASPNAFTGLSDSVFSGCTGLTVIRIPSGTETVDVRAFSGCTGLKRAILPSGIKSIRDEAFSGCTSLTDVNIPESVTDIFRNAFKSCVKIKSLTLPSGLTSLGNYAFSYCEELSDLGEIGKSVSNIGTRAFYKCLKLSEIKVSEENSSYKSVNGNLYTKDGRTLIQYAVGKRDTEFNIPDGVESIDVQACAWSQAKRINAPGSIKSVGALAFDQCRNCLTYNFSDCTSIPSLGANAFTQINQNAEIRVPAELYSDFCESAEWSFLKEFFVRTSKGYAGCSRGSGAPCIWEDSDSWSLLFEATVGYCEFNGTVYKANEISSKTGVKFACIWEPTQGYKYRFDDSEALFTEAGEYRFFVETTDGMRVYEVIADVR